MTIVLTLTGFICGSLMFSYWLGQIVNKDLKRIGDGNPGAFNLWKAAGFKFGMAGIVLDFMKGYLPLAIILEFGMVQGYAVIPVTIAPILGHVFSPFMKFKGGKAIAVTFGVWSALTRFEVSLVYAVILAVLLVILIIIKKYRIVPKEADGFQVVLGMLLLSFYLYLRHYGLPLYGCWLANWLILIYTNRKELALLMRGRSDKTGKTDDHFVM